MLGMTAALVTALVYEGWSRRGGAWRYAASVVTYAVAVAATPLVSPLPVLLLLLDAWPLGRLDIVAPVEDRRLARRLAEKLPFAVPAIAAIARTVGSITHTVGTSPDVAAGVWVANAFAAVARYLGLLILPIGLTPIRSVTPPPWWTPGAVLGIAAATAAVVAAGRAPGGHDRLALVPRGLGAGLGSAARRPFTALPSLRSPDRACGSDGMRGDTPASRRRSPRSRSRCASCSPPASSPTGTTRRRCAARARRERGRFPAERASARCSSRAARGTGGDPRRRGRAPSVPTTPRR
jgi:hypothetical protein